MAAKTEYVKPVSTLTVEESLLKARSLIEDPARWMQGRGGDRQRVFCLSTALQTADPYGFARGAELLREEAGTWLSTFNDSHTHQEVLELLDKALDRARRN